MAPRRAFALVLAFALATAAAYACRPGRARAAGGAPVRTWPIPVPHWFWTWARWYLGRAEFAETPLREPGGRPAAAPGRIPPWAWLRLAQMTGANTLALPETVLRAGDHGPNVRRLQLALGTANYVVGPVDGRFGAKTRDAVIAWQKTHGEPRDGVVSPPAYVLVLRTLPPDPPLPSRRDYDYVDLDRQVLLEVRGGRTRHVLPVFTGGGYAYTGRDGATHVATTPPGVFQVFRKVPGRDKSYLGVLWYPSYFNGGIALHGDSSVPTRAASHGCVRVPKWAAPALYSRTPVGTTVIVR
jgi:N-acetylmuramoyl-L-alanine amidase